MLYNKNNFTFWRMIRMKKLLLLLLVGLLFLSPLIAGGSNENESVDTDIEEVYYFSGIGAYKTLLEEEIANWNDTEGTKLGIRIIKETNIDNYAITAQTMMESGTFPDIIDTAWENPNWVAAGWIKNLYEVDALKDLVDRFEPYFAQGVNLQGDFLVGLPNEVLPLKMVYNVELFEKSGLSGPPATLEELVEYAKIITEKGDGEFYGFGWTTMWTKSWRRLAMNASMSSTGVHYFNSNTAKYDFTPFEPVISAYTKMYQDGSMFPTPLDQHIDPIRNRFAEGLVGMEIAPAYDISVYNVQFPSNFNWKVADVPAFTDQGLLYKGISLNRANASITSGVSDDRMWAVSEAFRFLHSEELIARLYSNCAIIPHEKSIIDKVNAVGFEKVLNNWEKMADITNYTFVPPFPDSLLTVKGDNFHTVFTNIMLGETSWDAEIMALNNRYNEAYVQAKTDGKINIDVYEKPYNNTK
jgi:multiple sugar transport system substrate-binding protein